VIDFVDESVQMHEELHKMLRVMRQSKQTSLNFIDALVMVSYAL
jgi:hypothetical protein